MESTVIVMVLLSSIQAIPLSVLIACRIKIVVTFKVPGSYVIEVALVIALKAPVEVLLCH